MRAVIGEGRAETAAAPGPTMNVEAVAINEHEQV